MKNTGIPKRHLLAHLGLLAVLLSLLALAVLAVTEGWPMFEFRFSERALAEWMRSWGVWGIAGSIGLMIVHSFIPFPAEFLALANGIVYGAVLGATVTWVGAMLGALLAFGLARWLGRPFVERMIHQRHWESVDHWAGREGAQALLLSRLVPVIAFNLINYAAGLMNISWWTFTWTTALGILPLTLLMAVMGANIADLSGWFWLLLVGFAAVAWYALRRLHQRMRNKQ